MAEHIAPCAGILLPDTSGVENIQRTDSIAMGMISATTGVIPVMSVIQTPTVGTSLARVCGVDVLYSDARKLGFILDELSQAIETPPMETMVVFTACSCRIANSRKGFQFNIFPSKKIAENLR